MHSTAVALVAGVLLAAAGHAQEPTVEKDVSGAEELVRTKGRFEQSWVRPDADLSGYDALYLWEPEFEFREGGATGAGTTTQLLRGDGGGPYAVRKEDRQRFRKLVTETFVAELERSRLFEVVDEIGPHTLIVRAGFLDITSDVPPNPARIANIYLASVGEATIVFELIDAETGLIQARAAERRQIQPEHRMRGVSSAPANAATVWADVERWARDQAEELRRALERAKRKAAAN